MSVRQQGDRPGWLRSVVLRLFGRPGPAAQSDGGLLERIFLGLELLWLLLVGRRHGPGTGFPARG